jgi:N-methylhydantoinase A
LHLSAFAKRSRPDLTRLPRRATKNAAVATRPVYFGGAASMLATRIYERAALAPGFQGEGPALLEEYGSTTIIWPGDRFEIGALGEIRIHCAGN